MIRTLLKRLLNRYPQHDTLSSLEAYARWAESYPAEAHNQLMRIEQESMRSLMPDLTQKCVLDLACGTGRYGLIAEQAGAASVFGIDNSFAMLETGKLAESICGTTAAIPLQDESIDVILCGLALGHLPSINLSLQEISRILKPNGVALISDFHPYQFLLGRRRTFNSNGVTYEVEHYVHHVSEYVTVAKDFGLHLTGIDEPVYDKLPVVLVMQFTKNS